MTEEQKNKYPDGLRNFLDEVSSKLTKIKIRNKKEFETRKEGRVFENL